MTIKKFIIISVLIHICIVAGLYFIPEETKNKSREFIARLVSPEEIPKPVIKPVTPPPIMKKKTPARRVPRPPVPIVRPHLHSPDKPVVPGMGKETGRKLPEGMQPGPGKSKTPGEGLDARTRPGSTNSDGRSRRSGAHENGPISSKPGYLDRAKLFDPGVIADAARMEESGAQKKKDDAVTFDTSDYRYAGYMARLKEKLETIGEYPPEAVAEKKYGDALIRFTILKNGKLGAVDLVRTSGHRVLDKAAMKALKDSEPYWPIPDEWGMDSYTILGHFVYTIYGYELR